MKSQIVVANKSHHTLHIKRVHHKQEWTCDGEHEYSWSMPIKSDCVTKYEVKRHDRVLAEFWINHNGFITSVKNMSKHVCVSKSDRFAQSEQPINGYGRYGRDVGDWHDELIDAVCISGESQV